MKTITIIGKKSDDTFEMRGICKDEWGTDLTADEYCLAMQVLRLKNGERNDTFDYTWPMTW